MFAKFLDGPNRNDSFDVGETPPARLSIEDTDSVLTEVPESGDYTANSDQDWHQVVYALVAVHDDRSRVWAEYRMLAPLTTRQVTGAGLRLL